MKKRKRQIFLYLVMIVVLSAFYIQSNRLYFSPEDVFYACERGLRSGPSEEIILKQKLNDGGLMLVGREENGLFIVPVERTHFFLWRLKYGTGVDGFLPADKPLSGRITYDGRYLGLCQDKDITEFSILVGSDGGHRWREEIYPVEEELLFFERDIKGMDKKGGYIGYTEARNADGEILFQEGDDHLLEAVRSGEAKAQGLHVMKPFVTAPAAKEMTD